MGHHFSSIAGAGPINGPIQAAVFGWVPVFLWVVIGGIFFGAMHDFGALFASIRHGGRSIGEVIKDNIGPKAYKLFVIFALLVLILVIASFTSVVASTFQSTVDANGNPYDFITVGMDNASGNASTATTSLLFIVIAIIFGYFVYRRGAKVGPATVVGVIGIIVITFIGLNVGINLPRTPWSIFIAVYITLASLLQAKRAQLGVQLRLRVREGLFIFCNLRLGAGELALAAGDLRLGVGDLDLRVGYLSPRVLRKPR